MLTIESPIAPTLETTVTPTVAQPLTATQEDMLLTIAAAHEKPTKVKAGVRNSTQPRAWSRGGNVD